MKDRHDPAAIDLEPFAVHFGNAYLRLVQHRLHGDRARQQDNFGIDQAVLNETKIGITKMHGKWFEVDGRWIMPIFHPAYLLRNPDKSPGSPKALMWQDIQAVRRKYDELGLGASK